MRQQVSWGFGLGLGLMLVICMGGVAFGVVEVGLGIMAPGGAGSALGTLVVVPHAAVGLGFLAVGADLWMSPGNDNFVFLPFLQLQIPLALVNIHGSIAPIFLGSPGGLELVPPPLGFAAKVGISASPFGFIGVYGDLFLGIYPLLMNISTTSLVVGVSFGF